ncbi:MAG: glutathione S-transferase family protein [Thermoanaerobaculales bacterium]|jgi:glutathione S-transferase|nr:glutathione S-transferase family protein [Thermoanaerobaculales bacterium]
MHKLVTIRFSHYNEKARWALDRFRVGYRESVWMPLFHMLGVVAATRGRGTTSSDRASTRFSTPVLIADDGTVLRDSAAIVHWASDRFAGEDEGLYPTNEVSRLEARLHDELGPHTRRCAYFYGLDDTALVHQLAHRNVPRPQAALFIALRPFIGRMLTQALVLKPETAERSLAKIRRFLDDVEPHLTGRQYLIGDRFTAADLAFACMLAPSILPSPAEGYGGFLPPPDRVAAPAAELAREIRQRPAGRFALRLFAEERGERQVPVKPLLKG